MGGRPMRRTRWVVSLLAVGALSAAACTPRTEIPSDSPGTVPAIAPGEKNVKPCGYEQSDICGPHHNNRPKAGNEINPNDSSHGRGGGVSADRSGGNSSNSGTSGGSSSGGGSSGGGGGGSSGGGGGGR